VIPFVIVSYPRSGTHLLRTSLESHPAVVCQAEPFNSDDRRLPYPQKTPTADVLAGWVFHDRLPDEVKAAGFVLQAYHPHALEAFPGIRPNPGWADVWPRLAAMDGLRVLHLERRNLLARHLSHRMARATGSWHAWDPGAVDGVTHLTGRPPDGQIGPPQGARPRLAIDPAQLALDFAEVARWRRHAEEALSGHPLLRLTYEELCGDDSAATLARVQAFLGLEARPLRSAVSRLEERPPERAIENYAELKHHFAGSPWESFFV
jgi:LPS sulfotransferase NodH